MPPLRERPEDVTELLRYCVDRLVDDEALPFRRFSVAAQNRLRHYPWPGNVRELESLVRKLLVAGGSEEIGLAELEEALQPPATAREPLVGGPAQPAARKRASSSSAPTSSSSSRCAVAGWAPSPSGSAWSAPTSTGSCVPWAWISARSATTTDQAGSRRAANRSRHSSTVTSSAGRNSSVTALEHSRPASTITPTPR